MAKRKKLTKAQALRRKRESRVEELVLEGCTNVRDIAAALGVSIGTVHNYQQRIYKRWAAGSDEDLKLKNMRAVKRLERVAFAALQAFARSQENEMETTTQHRTQVCTNCNGTGADGECDVCEGTGKVAVEVVTQKVKGKAGDSSFLNVARACFSDISKLEGTAPKEGGNVFNIAMLDSKAIDKFKSLPKEEIRRLRKVHQTAILTSQIRTVEEEDNTPIIIDARPKESASDTPDDPPVDETWD